MTFDKLVEHVPLSLRGRGWFVVPDEEVRKQYPVFVRCPGCAEGVMLPAEAHNLILVEDTMYVCVNHISWSKSLKTICYHYIHKLGGWGVRHTDLVIKTGIVRIKSSSFSSYQELPT